MNVIVVGAGIGGLSCATALQSAGHNVVVVEKSRGSSGRMSTRRTEQTQWDHGAQYFTARDRRFKSEVHRWVNAAAAATWPIDIAVIGEAETHTKEANLLRYVGTPSMTSPAKLLSKFLTLKLQHTVVSIRKKDSGWVVTTLEQGEMETLFDAVVLAIPAHQASPLLSLIDHPFARQTAGVKMFGSWTLMLGYKESQKMAFDAAFVNKDPLRWVARDSSKPGRKSDIETWVLQASSEWSERYIDAKPEDITPILLAAFRGLGASDPDECIAHRWRYADTQNPLKDAFLWDDQSKVGICGDWINGGKVEGAWLSGLYLAEKICS